MSVAHPRMDIRQAGKPLLLVLLGWFVLCLVGYFLLVRPKVQEFSELELGSQPKQLAFKQRKAQVEKLEAYLDGLRRAESDLTTLREEILSTREARMVEVHREVQRLCAQFNIELESVDFGGDILPEEGLDRAEMVVPLEGGYANLRKFLQAIEDSDKFLLVERVALGESKEGGVILQLNITVTTYFDDPETRRKLARPRSRRSRRA